MTGAYDPQATAEYIPGQSLQSTGKNAKDSTAADPNKTGPYTGPIHTFTISEGSRT